MTLYTLVPSATSPGTTATTWLMPLQSRAVLTFNVADFELLATEWFFAGRGHAGIILSDQIPIGELLRRVERLLQRVPADEMQNSLRYLQAYKS